RRARDAAGLGDVVGADVVPGWGELTSGGQQLVGHGRWDGSTHRSLLLPPPTSFLWTARPSLGCCRWIVEGLAGGFGWRHDEHRLSAVPCDADRGASVPADWCPVGVSADDDARCHVV